MDVEKLACNEIESLLARVGNISTNFTSNDKTMSWDGWICLGTKENKNGQIPKSDFFGRIPVQIKGHQCKSEKDLKQKSVNFPIDTRDLKNYRKDGGVLFFVVHIGANKTSEIYFVKLLPTIIDLLIAGKDKQRTISTRLQPFPKESEAVHYLLFTFYEDLKLQTSFFPENIMKFSEFENYLKTGISFRTHIAAPNLNSNSAMNYLLKNPLSIYVVKNGIEIPVEGMARFSKVNSNMNISICGKKYFNSCSYFEQDNDFNFLFGNLISLTLKKDSSVSLKFQLNGFLNQRLITLDFILNMIRTRSFQFDDKIVNLPEGMFNQSKVRKLEEIFEFLEDLKDTLEILKVDSDLDLNILSKNDLQSLRILIAAIKYKEPVELREEELAVGFISIGIRNLQILLFIQKTESKKWIITNFFSISFVLKNKKQFISHYVLLKKNDFIKISNIDYLIMTQAILNIDKQKESYDHYNALLLEMLLAYDEVTKHQNELIYSATKIAKMIYQYVDFPKEISILNYYQCIKRQRDLTDEEFDKIDLFAKNSNLEAKFKTGAYLLIENQGKARRSFNSMSEDDKDQFKTFPIMRFGKFISELK